MQRQVYRKTISTHDRGNVCDILAELSGLSKSRIKRAMNQGAVWRQRKGGKQLRLRRATTVPVPGDRIWLYYDASILALEGPAAECISDCKRYSVWFKPAGLMTQGTPFGDHCALTRQAELHFKPRRRVYVIHRIDRETAGLVILSHDADAASRFSALFRNRAIEKHYLAWVRGNLHRCGRKGEIALSLDGRNALTRYRCLHYEAETDQSLVDVKLITGRTHQIRRHFDLIGYPVVGDPRYGRRNQNKTDLQLVARSLRFHCPLTKRNKYFYLDYNYLDKKTSFNALNIET